MHDLGKDSAVILVDNASVIAANPLSPQAAHEYPLVFGVQVLVRFGSDLHAIVQIKVLHGLDLLLQVDLLLEGPDLFHLRLGLRDLILGQQSPYFSLRLLQPLQECTHLFGHFHPILSGNGKRAPDGPLTDIWNDEASKLKFQEQLALLCFFGPHLLVRNAILQQFSGRVFIPGEILLIYVSSHIFRRFDLVSKAVF